MSITHVFVNDRAVASDNALPTSLSPDAQMGKLASITVTLGAGVTTITLPDWAQGVIISPVTDAVRFAVDEDPVADATSSATAIAADDFAVGATAPADDRTVRLLASGTGRTLRLLGTAAASVSIEVF